MEFVSFFYDDEWIRGLAYLIDIFEQLSKLNLKMQGKSTNIILFEDTLAAFISKLDNWKTKI